MNERQTRFCLEYSVGLNATAAAIAAGYSENSAYAQGHGLLKNLEVQSKIAEYLDERRLQQARQFTLANDAAIAALLEIIGNSRASAQARVAAATAILDRGGHAVVTKSLIKAEVNVNELTNEQRIDRLNYLLEQGRSRRIGADTPGDTGPD